MNGQFPGMRAARAMSLLSFRMGLSSAATRAAVVRSGQYSILNPQPHIQADLAPLTIRSDYRRICVIIELL